MSEEIKEGFVSQCQNGDNWKWMGTDKVEKPFHWRPIHQVCPGCVIEIYEKTLREIASATYAGETTRKVAQRALDLA